MRVRVALAVYAVWMTALGVAYFVLSAQAPEIWSAVLWAALSLTSAATVVAGVLLRRPSHRWPWYALAFGILTYAVGDTTYNVLKLGFGQANPFPSLADVFYLPMYPAVALALVGFIRLRHAGGDRGSLLDALSLTAGLALLSWIFLINPYVQDGGESVLFRAISVAYPLGDVIILATVLRLVLGAGRPRAATLLAVGAAALLVSDTIYGLGQLRGEWDIGTVGYVGWVLGYLLWGAAALDPSMAELTVRVRRPAVEAGAPRLVVLALSSLVAPAMLLVEAVRGRITDAAMIAVTSVVMFGLVLARLSGMIARQRQSGERERQLREVGAELVSATDTEAVVASVRAAVGRLLPADEPHLALVRLGDAATALLAGLPGVDPEARRPGRLVPAGAAGPTGTDLTGFPTVLLCPLVQGDPSTTARVVGVLVVAADENLLVALQGALEVLASQGALALERVSLTRQVSRRDSEAYFRTLVQNAHDVILIVGDDDVIRYASPSARAVFGLHTLVGFHIGDGIHPDDRERAQRSIADIRTGGALGYAASYRIRHADRSYVDVEVTSRDLRRDPTVGGVVLTLRDVTARSTTR